MITWWLVAGDTGAINKSAEYHLHVLIILWRPYDCRSACQLASSSTVLLKYSIQPLHKFTFHHRYNGPYITYSIESSLGAERIGRKDRAARRFLRASKLRSLLDIRTK